MSDQDWKPAFQLDLEKASAAAFDDIRKRQAEWGANQPVTPLPFTKNGWYTITPEMAETLLIRNAAATAPLQLAVVIKYARMQKAGDWKRTGQPLIFNRDGKGEDFQHRVWACYLGGASFECYDVMVVPVDPFMFAYYDGGKPRSGVDALQTRRLQRHQPGDRRSHRDGLIGYEAGGFLADRHAAEDGRSARSLDTGFRAEQPRPRGGRPHPRRRHYAGAVKAIANRGRRGLRGVATAYRISTVRASMESFFHGDRLSRGTGRQQPRSRRYVGGSILDVVSQDKGVEFDEVTTDRIADRGQ